MRSLPGGKGANQALAARRAGAEVAMIGAVGRDAFAAIALDPLRRAGIDTRLVTSAAAPTGCAAIMVCGAGENMIAVASGANATVRADQVPDALLGPGTILVAQMEVPVAETAAVVRRVRARGGTSLLNLAPALPIDLELMSEIDLIVANEGEAAGLGADPAAIGRGLRRGLVVTRGAAGAVAHLADRASLAVPALPIVAVDTTGAGDTFVGVARGGARLRRRARDRTAAGECGRRPRLPRPRRASRDARRRGDRCGASAAGLRSATRSRIQLTPHSHTTPAKAGAHPSAARVDNNWYVGATA